MSEEQFWPEFARYVYDRHVDDKGRPNWPESPGDRRHLARALLGFWLASELDAEIELARKLIEIPEPFEVVHQERGKDVEAEYFRAELSSLTESQRRAVLSLVQNTAYGILFRLLTTMDGVTGYEPIYSFLSTGPKWEPPQDLVPLTDKGLEELHDCLGGWLLSFSKYADDLVEYRTARFGWEIGFKPADKRVQPDIGEPPKMD
jgi:hypothetical protein